jgi:hypothetical protein
VHAIANVWAPWLLLPWLVLVAFLFLPKHLALIWNDETRMTAEALRDVHGATGTNDD